MNPKKLARPKYWKEGVRELTASDPILAKIIQRNKGIKLYSHQDPFLTLLRAIVSQQISSLAAKKLSEKILFLISLENCASTGNLQDNNYESVFLASKSSFKRLGLSHAKYSCITEVANSLNNNKQYWKIHAQVVCPLGHAHLLLLPTRNVFAYRANLFRETNERRLQPLWAERTHHPNPR